MGFVRGLCPWALSVGFVRRKLIEDRYTPSNKMQRNVQTMTDRTQLVLSAFEGAALVGSSGQRGLFFGTDFDLFQVVVVTSRAEALRKLRKVVKDLLAIPSTYVPELKCGGRKYTAMEFLRDTPTIAGMIKIDSVTWLDTRFTEISCVYEFIMNGKSLNPQPSHAESLKQDMNEFLKDGQYMKAARRLQSLLRLEGRPSARLQNLFNSELGALYAIVSDISTLELLDMFPRKLADIEFQHLRQRIGQLTLHPVVKLEPYFLRVFEDLRHKSIQHAKVLLKSLESPLRQVLEARTFQRFWKHMLVKE